MAGAALWGKTLRMGKKTLCLGFLFALCGGLWAPATTGALAGDSISAYFSPFGGGTDAIVSELRNAKREILVQAYSFTSAPIAKALVDARKRGVAVTVVLDKSQRKGGYSSADFLRNNGVATYIDDKHAIAHNKIMVIDGDVIVTGSFNFTKAAEEKNAENILVIRGNPALASKYHANFAWHLKHSVRYEGRLR